MDMTIMCKQCDEAFTVIWHGMLWHGMLYSQRQTPYTVFLPQKQATSARFHLEYSYKLYCSMRTSACDTKTCKIMLAQLARTLDKWHCISFTELIEEIDLWE